MSTDQVQMKLNCFPQKKYFLGGGGGSGSGNSSGSGSSNKSLVDVFLKKSLSEHSILDMDSNNKNSSLQSNSSGSLDSSMRSVDPNTGTVYERGKILGKGGFAKVWEVEDMTSNAIFADKVISKDVFVKKKTTAEKVKREIAIHRHLRHVNVVAFRSYFDDGKNIHIIMEHCAKKSLLHIMKNNTLMSEERTRHFMTQICAGVQYIHSRGILHRDLKLGNMFLTGSDVVKIGDFGLATRIECASVSTLCGTPNYIAPEVLLKQSHGVEADVWAMGCMAFAMLTGKPPFETKNLETTYAKIASNEYDLPDHLSPAVTALIRKLLHPDPTKRGNLRTDPNEEHLLLHRFLRGDQPAPFTNPPLSVTSAQSPLQRGAPSSKSGRSHSRTVPPPMLNLAASLSQLISTLDCVLNSTRVAYGSPRHAPKAPALPVPFVSKWIDYSNKYGFGYQLSDKTLGILFNDASSIVRVGSSSLCQFTTAPAPSSSSPSGRHASSELSQFDIHFPASHTRHQARLLQHFAEYMEENLADGKVGGVDHDAAGVGVSGRRPVQLVKWRRSETSIVLLLDNHSVQVNFLKTHQKALFWKGSQGQKEVIFVTFLHTASEETGPETIPLTEANNSYRDILNAARENIAFLQSGISSSYPS